MGSVFLWHTVPLHLWIKATSQATLCTSCSQAWELSLSIQCGQGNKQRGQEQPVCELSKCYFSQQVGEPCLFFYL